MRKLELKAGNFFLYNYGLDCGHNLKRGYVKNQFS